MRDPTPSERFRTDRLLAAVLVFVMLIPRFFADFSANGTDQLPFARQQIFHDWLPQDWYLNQSIPHRMAFNLIAGPLTQLGFNFALAAGNALTFGLFAVAFSVLGSSLGLAWPSTVLGVLFFFLFHQSIAASESMVSGFEAKALAYPLILTAFAQAIDRRTLRAAALFGLAVSFHVLVGGYAVASFLFALAVVPALRPERSRALLFAILLFIVCGAFGIRALLIELGSPHAEALEAAKITVELRLPHHLLPRSWAGHGWVIRLALVSLILLFGLLRVKDQRRRFLCAAATGALLFFYVGLLLDVTGPVWLLKYYWFRFGDSFSLATACILGAALCGTCRSQIGGGPWRKIVASLPAIAASCALLFAGRQIFYIVRPNIIRYERDRSRLELLDWIARSTPKTAVILADPSEATSDFYVRVERALVVSFKHFPQTAPDIVEWKKRIDALAPGSFGQRNGFAASRRMPSIYYSLNGLELRRLASLYGATYIIARPGQLPFLPKKICDNLAIYAVDDAPE